MKAIHNIFFLLLTVAGFFCTACNSEGLTDETGNPAVISLTMSNIQTRGGDLFADESLITKVRVYVFNGNFVDKMQVFNTGETEFQNPFRVQTTTGTKNVYVVANEPADMTSALDAVTTLSMLKAIVTSPVSGSLSAPFTMVGSENVTVAYVPDPGPYTQVTVNLTRLVAKLNLIIKKGATSTADIRLKGVRLYRAAAKSALIEGQPLTGQTYFNHTYAGLGTITLTTTGIDAWTGASSVYVFENPGTVTDTLNRATYIMIDALYNNVPTQYRAYINDDHSDATDHHYSIKRNHQYNLTATITNIGEFDGLTLSTYVLPWNLLQSQILFDWVYTITPHPTTTSYTYTAANPTDMITFTFKLENPLGATWTAQLSNPFDFEFSTVGGAVSSGGLGTEYTISIKPRNAQSATARTTEFYITVNGTEVPLLQGSTLVGTGNRVVINQPATP